jgi:acetyl-CoA carboxylase biotin carboxyl carrier protein
VGETAEDGRAAEPDNRHPIVAPLVGTFYRSPQPGAKPFVEEGDLVEKGQTVAIVEAMKIMNQIQADRAGRVAQIMVQDAEWVEFQQVLIYLEPSET